MVNVFVYGTLRKGEVNARLLKNAACKAEQCWTNGSLFDTDYGYPAMTQSPSSRVYGELYSVTAEELERLDASLVGRGELYSKIYRNYKKTVPVG